MEKRMKYTMKTMVIFLFALCLLPACQKEDTPAQAPPPPEVNVLTTKAENVPIYQTYVGQVYGAKDIAIRARVEGFLNGIHFQEGSIVKKDALLYTIDRQPFEAQVAAQKGLVAEANTKVIKARNDLNRYRPLAAKNAVSQSDLDAAKAQFDAAQGGLDAANANLQAVNIQMGYTNIYSPITGIIGKTKAKAGDFVGRDPNPVILNTVSNTDHILVEFFLSETQYLIAARRFIAESPEQRKTAEKQDTGFQLILADDSIYSHKGKATFIDRQVDPMTGAILVQASFPNPEGLLRPGQFAKVKIQIDTATNGILVPQRAVTELQGMTRVFVVDEKNTVQERKVKLGPTVDNLWLIREGVKSGERVIFEGIQKIADGIVVKPVETQFKRIKQDGQ
jgi:membrane fusion protein, multidrug efflux system